MEADWQRPHFAPGGGDALVFFVAFGRPVDPLEISSSTYRVTGLPATIGLRSHPASVAAELLAPPLGPLLVPELGGPTAEALSADGCMIVSGTVPDPPDLLYLRECVGVVMALLDAGCSAAYTPQSMAMHTGDSWRASLFEPDMPTRHHVKILHSDEEAHRATGTHWVHTRGLRQFGRPDISVRDVPPNGFDGAVELCNRFAEHLAFGLIVPDGQPVRVDGLPDGMVCRTRGDLEDPDFNNVHIEIVWPSP